eukprot:m.76149 g.76149  ORF g.76149 m.76149 type:complete len:94 (+) comp12545_c0_seq2:1883-2164(+)
MGIRDQICLSYVRMLPWSVSIKNLQASQLCSQAPLRNMLESGQTLESLKGDEIEPIRREHFSSALRRVRPSVHVSELTAYEEWNKQFGSAESF